MRAAQGRTAAALQERTGFNCRRGWGMQNTPPVPLTPLARLAACFFRRPCCNGVPLFVLAAPTSDAPSVMWAPQRGARTAANQA